MANEMVLDWQKQNGKLIDEGCIWVNCDEQLGNEFWNENGCDFCFGDLLRCLP